MSYPMKVFSGSSNPVLVKEVTECLGLNMGKISIQRFADGEIGIQILEHVRGCDVFVIQSTCSPVNDNLMELFLIVDALKRASAKRITAVIPYFGYARQDRKTQPRVPISAALVAQLIETSGVDRVISLDLHCGQIQGFFRISVDNLYGAMVLSQATALVLQQLQQSNICVVSPDAGGAERTDSFRNSLKKYGYNATMAVMNKKRVEANRVDQMELVGDVKDKNCLIIDDMIDTAGTLCACANVLKEHGAQLIMACISHALLNGNAIEKINNSAIEKVFVTNSNPISEEKLKSCPKLQIVSIGKELAEALRRTHNEESISLMF